MITDQNNQDWYTIPEAQEYSREYYDRLGGDQFYSISYIRRLCLWSGPEIDPQDRKIECKKLSDTSREWLINKDSWHEYMKNSNQGPHKAVSPHTRILNGKIIDVSSKKFG